MKKALTLILAITFSMFIFEGCTTSEKQKTLTPTQNTDKFRTINSNRNTNGITVACSNCRAKFKISLNAMKSGTTIKCPKCNHHYRN